MRHTTSYKTLYTMSYVRCLTYDIVLKCDIVGKNTVLANRTYNIVYDIVYDVVRQTYDIVYDINKTYYIVGLGTVLANRTYDVVYDVVRQRTISYTICFATSVLYDVVR
jgi:hypothetical protein